MAAVPDLIFPPAQQKPPDPVPPDPEEHVHDWQPIEASKCSVCGVIAIPS